MTNFLDTNTLLFVLLIFIVSTVFGLGWFCLGWYTSEARVLGKNKQKVLPSNTIEKE